jgi:hypothetical protein
MSNMPPPSGPDGVGLGVARWGVGVFVGVDGRLDGPPAAVDAPGGFDGEATLQATRAAANAMLAMGRQLWMFMFDLPICHGIALE